MGMVGEFALVGTRIEVPVGPGEEAIQRCVTRVSLDTFNLHSLEGSGQMS